jgi:hypothetical protein
MGGYSEMKSTLRQPSYILLPKESTLALQVVPASNMYKVTILTFYIYCAGYESSLSFLLYHIGMALS